jgi:hypothetical protein
VRSGGWGEVSWAGVGSKMGRGGWGGVGGVGLWGGGGCKAQRDMGFQRGSKNSHSLIM